MQATSAALRPMGPGDVIDRAFRMYRSHALGLLGLTAIPLAVLVAGLLLLAALSVAVWTSLGIGWLSADSTTPAAPAAPRSTPGLAGLLADLLLVAGFVPVFVLPIGAIIAGAAIDAAAATHLGQSCRVASSLGIGLRTAPRLLLTGLTLFLCLFLVAFIAVAIFAGIEIDRNEPLFLVATVVYLFVVLYLSSSWFVAPAIATIERHGPISSLRRSWQLARGFHWRIGGLGVLLVVLFGVPFVFGALVAAFLDIALGRPHIFDSAVMFFVLVFAMILAWLPLFFGAMTVVYYDLRVRKEGFDLQLAAQAMSSPTVSGPAGKRP